MSLSTLSLSSSFQALVCPLDGQPLTLGDGAWRCSAGHSFDVAKQGYVNLLPVQNKRSTDPGDSKAMVAARQRFLSAGFYAPIAQRVSEMTLQEAPPAPLRCLDAGCGEGYYLRQLASHAANTPLELVGLDISKWAVLQAAKQSRRAAAESERSACWLVGSNANLPIQTASLDRLWCLFGFPVAEEFSRVLAPGGVWLQGEAGPNHLRELREIIYPSLKAERDTPATPPPSFLLGNAETLSYRITLDTREAIADLLTMTPHLYRASPEGRARAQALDTLSLTVEVRLTEWVKAAN
ncbi:putative RNA methyltransferase [Halomonas dongshanensis]|uniref:Methyltransferase domain-containing protein n=1 Tax=Halomonas dongshanensis TaxID=2890835 RepID=A0ABT2EAH1_9GAMM|nr:methyltransferase domain-containing protein [Halomonas dongshanensis]MCS2608561.1 methyltransferase domain-containing protein [Halomonas dongshanensis]